MQTVAAHARGIRRAAVSMTGVWLRGVRGEEPGGLIANEATSGVVAVCRPWGSPLIFSAKRK